LQLEEVWAGKRRPTTDTALWLKPRWADTRPSSVLACKREASLAKKAEAAVGVAVLNRMLDAGRPDSARRLNIAA
jgi:hypothetical protein